jgi:hypothetical protein
VVQGAALTVAENASEIEDARLAGGQQLLRREFRRGVEVEGRARAVRAEELRGEGVQVRLVAGRDLQRRGFDLGEALLPEPRAQRRDDAPTRGKERTAVGMDGSVPPRRSRSHRLTSLGEGWSLPVRSASAPGPARGAVAAPTPHEVST